jgi:hypothetical protein
MGAFVATTAADAAEPTTSDKASAQALFDEAKDLAASDNWAQACPKLEESQRLDPHMVTLFRLADCYEHVGRTASASVLFKEAASLARDAGAKAREKAASARAAALEPSLTRLAIAVPDIPGIRVTRDDVEIGRQQWGLKVPVDPGPHTVVASAPGRKTFRSVVTLTGSGSVLTVTVPSLESEESGDGFVSGEPASAPDPAAAPAPALAPDPAPRSPLSPLGLAGGITFGVGAAITTTSIVLLATNRSTQSASCSFSKCELPGVLFWAGAIITVSGGAMWLAYRASAPSTQVYVSLGARAVGVGATF